jgi:hypothetical protein
MCLECGQKYPIEQQQPKGKLSTIDESDSNSIGVVQPQNYQTPKPRPLRERSPLEEELTAKGYTVIDSQWITPGYYETIITARTACRILFHIFSLMSRYQPVVPKGTGGFKILPSREEGGGYGILEL